MRMTSVLIEQVLLRVYACRRIMEIFAAVRTELLLQITLELDENDDEQPVPPHGPFLEGSVSLSYLTCVKATIKHRERHLCRNHLHSVCPRRRRK